MLVIGCEIKSLPLFMQKMALESESVGSNQLPVGLQGFHPQNPGIEFRQAYRWGLSGPYLRIVKVSFKLTYHTEARVPVLLLPRAIL